MMADATDVGRERVTVRQSGMIPVTTHVPAWAWRCEECGWVGAGFGSAKAAAAEAADHLWREHGIAACNPDELVGFFPHEWERVKGTDSTDQCVRCGRYCGK